MVTKRIPKAKVSESTRYRMEADTVSCIFQPIVDGVSG